jgi:hypothetical protein
VIAIARAAPVTRLRVRWQPLNPLAAQGGVKYGALGLALRCACRHRGMIAAWRVEPRWR